MNEQLFQAINRYAGQWDWIDDCMEWFAQDIVWVLLAIMAILWFSGKPNHQRLTFYACLSAAITLFVAAYFISPAVNHPRPFVGHEVNQLIPHAADPSFPSDHSILAFSLAFSVFFVLRNLGTVMLALAVLTGLARVYVGVHYPADIAGAIVLSFLVSLAVFLLRERLEPLPRLTIGLYGRIVKAIPGLPKK
ncbi:undecaprenyl-diphosphatase [Cohnella terricola]|nr:undecaprenyl-diphosphatase [Cohnella terricola]